VSWHAVDAEGRDLATGQPPGPPGHGGWPSPAAALAAAPVAAWPIGIVGDGGRCLSLARALGPGGDRVEGLLDALAGRRDPDALAGTSAVDVEALARATPAGTVSLPLEVVGLRAGVEAAAGVDRAWLAAVDRGRAAPRQAMVEGGREAEMEAALHVAMLLATERLDPADDAEVDAHIASGARLWLLAGAVVSALAGVVPDPFEGWARLIVAGWWPVGPSGSRLVVSDPAPGVTARRAG